jgi:hypothetical protein
MSQPAFFTAYPLPVFEHLSQDSKRQLESYILSGNTEFRQKRLLEFFKTLDWISAEEAVEDRLLRKLDPTLRRQLSREIRDYHFDKSQNRAVNAEKREQYKLRIIEAFRAKVPSSDKALLESLRDYELDLTGRDVNWRYYFTLDSFKKIDAFVQASHAERQALFERFKKDVDTYQRNYEKIHQAQAAQACNHAFSFDDWCEMMGEEAPRAGQTRQNSQPSQAPLNNPVYQAYQTLNIPFGTTPELAKKQFRKLTLQHHPDLPNGSEETMKTLVGAYQELQRYWQASGL